MKFDFWCFLIAFPAEHVDEPNKSSKDTDTNKYKIPRVRNSSAYSVRRHFTATS